MKSKAIQIKYCCERLFTVGFSHSVSPFAIIFFLARLASGSPAFEALATFRLEYEDDYEYEFKVLSTRTSKIFALQA